jgi:hypothetical protein
VKLSLFKKNRFKKLSNSNLLDALILLIYKLSLDFAYVVTITPSFDYMGMHNHFFTYKYLISMAVLLLLLNSVIKLIGNHYPSASIILLLNLIYFFPGCTLYAFGGIPDHYFIFFASYWMILMILYYKLIFPRIKQFNAKLNMQLFLIIVFSIIAVSLTITGLYNSFNLYFSVENVYDLRFAQRDLDLPVIVHYLQPIASTLSPLIMVYLFIEKRPVWGIVMIFVQLLLFAFGGMKSTFFILIISILIYLFYKSSRNRYLAIGLFSLNIVALIEIIATKISYVSSFILFRVLFVPNLLSYYYYDYTLSHNYLLLRDSILRRIGFDSPYSIPLPYLIGTEYFNDPTNCANNGLAGDAYSNFGWLSLLLYPLMIVMVCKIFDRCSERLNPKIGFTAAFIFAIGFANSSFFSLMLTNGFILTCIMLFFMPRHKHGQTEDSYTGR